MPEGDGLGRLQMCEAGHDGRGVHFRLARERELQLRKRFVECINYVAHIKPEIGGYLIIARAPRMQAAGRRADHVLDACLDVHVHVLQGT